jgi:hypothetical protein
MATVTNCVVCGQPTSKHEYGHVHFKSKDGRDKSLFARHCDQHVHMPHEEIRRCRGVTKACGPGCYGEWRKEDGIRGYFRRPNHGKAYPATEELT